MGENVLAEKKKKKMQIPFRLNIVFFIVFLLFAVLVVQLGLVQILEGESYQKEIDRTIDDITKVPVPRGKIYDSEFKPVVENTPLYSITYTPPKGVKAEDKLKLAEKLVHYIEVEEEMIDKISERNLREYWYLKNEKKALKLTNDEEKKKLDDVEIYNLTLDRIKEKDLDEISEDKYPIIALKSELDKAYSLTPHIIKNKNITVKEYAKIAENLHDLQGINATTDWERKYLYKDTFKSFIGAITTEKEGLPEDKIDHFMSRGYNRNDRVGKSGLEEYYEDYLKGRKEQIKYTTTKTGSLIDSEVIVDGERGKDLVLTVDIDYQKKVDDVVMNALKKNVGSNGYLEDAMGVAMNPKTGEILALSAIHYDRKSGKYENLGVKTLFDSHLPGSTIKGATVLAGFENNVISPGTVFYDRPIKMAGTPTKSSVGTLGAVNDVDALRRSSNVYMFYIALKLGGEHRHPFPNNAGVRYDTAAIQKIRNGYSQVGLGVKTGIDFPYEEAGVKGENPLPGNILDFAIGQYDTYTALQLAQYTSTIANGGKRVKPYMVKHILNPGEGDELGSIYKSNETEILNQVNLSETEIKRIQSGFKGAFQQGGGTGTRFWGGKSYNPAGKTGTAESAVYRKVDGDYKKVAETENLTLVGYAPYDDPEIAFAVVVPFLNKSRSASVPINHEIGMGIMDHYFEMKKNKKED